MVTESLLKLLDQAFSYLVIIDSDSFSLVFFRLLKSFLHFDLFWLLILFKLISFLIASKFWVGKTFTTLGVDRALFRFLACVYKCAWWNNILKFSKHTIILSFWLTSIAYLGLRLEYFSMFFLSHFVDFWCVGFSKWVWNVS